MSISKIGKKLLALVAALVFVTVLTACATEADMDARALARENVNEVLSNVHFENPDKTVSSLEFTIRQSGLRPNDDITKTVYQHKYNGTVEVVSSNPDVVDVKWVKSVVREETIEYLRNEFGQVIYSQEDPKDSKKFFYIDSEGVRHDTTIKAGEAIYEVVDLNSKDVYKLVGALTRPAFGSDDVDVVLTFTVKQDYTYENESGEIVTATFSAKKQILFTVLAESAPLYEGSIAQLKKDALVGYTAALKYPVNFNGTVTAIHYREGQFQVADDEGGLFVFYSVDGLQIGDLVNVQGNITQYYGILQVGSDINVTVLGTNPEPIEPIKMSLAEVYSKKPDAVNGEDFGGQYIESEGYFKYYADAQGQFNYHLIDVQGNDIQIYYKSHILWEEPNILNNYLDKYVKMRYNVYTYFAAKNLWQVSFNLSNTTFVEIPEPVLTDEDKAGFAENKLMADYGKEFLYTEVVTLPTKDDNFDATYSFAVKAGDEAKMAIADGKLTFTPVTEKTAATLVATITVGTFVKTVEIPVEIAPLVTMTIAEVIALPLNTDILVAGKVVGYYQSGSSMQYYNYFLEDAAGDILFVYGTTAVVAAGDELVVKGQRGDYFGQPQVSNAVIVSRQAGEVKLPDVITPITMAELTSFKYGVAGVPYNQYFSVYAKRVGNSLVSVDDPTLKVTITADVAKLPAEGTMGTYNVFLYGIHSTTGVVSVVYTGAAGEYTAPQLSDAEKIAFDKELVEGMSGEMIAGDVFDLIATGVNGSTITWVADPADLIDANGVVGEGLLENATLTLTATLKVGDLTEVVVVTIEIIADIPFMSVTEAVAVPVDEMVYVMGYVKSIVNTQYGNVYLEDLDGNELYIYGIGPKDAFPDYNISVGDFIGVYGTRAVFNNVPQISSSSYVKHFPEYKVNTVAEMLAKEVGTDYFTVKGIVKNIINATYGNFDLEDEDGTKIYVYGLLTADGVSKQFTEMGIKVGDTLWLIGQRAAYNSVAQINNASFVKLVSGLTDEDKLAEDVAEIPASFGQKDGPFDLPDEGKNGSVITWEVVSGTAVTIVDGVVTEVVRPAEGDDNAVVTLKATLTFGELDPVFVTVTVEIVAEGESAEPELVIDVDFGQLNVSGYANYKEHKVINNVDGSEIIVIGHQTQTSTGSAQGYAEGGIAVLCPTRANNEPAIAFLQFSNLDGVTKVEFDISWWSPADASGQASKLAKLELQVSTDGEEWTSLGDVKDQLDATKWTQITFEGFVANYVRLYAEGDKSYTSNQNVRIVADNFKLYK